MHLHIAQGTQEFDRRIQVFWSTKMSYGKNINLFYSNIGRKNKKSGRDQL